MKNELIIHDEDARGNRSHSLRIPNTSSSILVKDLITRRVESEVARFNVQRPVCFFSLVQPAGAESTSRGFRLKEHRMLDASDQVKNALEGFNKKNYLINANARDFQNLDDVIDITDDTEIIFVKFVEVIGG